ncbi:SAG family member [Eimeria mitis]|uniref:SAG family member n=1 Tax=Eimeria mitis TaxID=44415 RepID=U6KA91_9EIME|nr:SAG family member [Eimeria mitis]CDJ33736.1 SAG family member [Eimeria mitis]
MDPTHFWGTAVCLGEINDAREAAGLAHFGAASDGEFAWPTTNADDNEQTSEAWDPVCDALIAKDSGEEAKKGAGTSEFKTGTYAFMALSTDQVDCAAAVDHWQDALNNFTSLPPSKADGKDLYDKPENVSFVAMYNPSGSAAADCRVVTCTARQSELSNLRSSNEAKTGYALLCLTTPDPALLPSRKFSANSCSVTIAHSAGDDQWSKIKASLTGSASVAAPSLIAFAIAALGLAAF